MRKRWIGIAVAVMLAAPKLSMGQSSDGPSDFLQITTVTADTFTDNGTHIVKIEGPVEIKTDRATLSGKSAIIWFRKVEGSVLGRQRADIAIIGDAKLTQGDITRTGDRLFVTTVIGGPVRLTADERNVRDPRNSDLYKQAMDIRPLDSTINKDQPDTWLLQQPWIEAPAVEPTTQPTTNVMPNAPITFNATDIQTTTNTANGNMAAVLRGGVLLIQRRPAGDIIELQADTAVLFTRIKEIKELQGGGGTAGMQDKIESAYLQGDVRIIYTPSAKDRKKSEQRLTADEVFYEFNTDRAVLTKAVLHTTDSSKLLPITVRAEKIKQLSHDKQTGLGEYATENAELTTSQFATPSYDIAANKAYIHQYNTGDQYGDRTAYQAESAKLRAGGVPFFWLPYMSGEMTEHGQPLRSIGLGSGTGQGVGVQTEWGLCETLGQLPTDNYDASYHLDYFKDRGPAIGLDAKYQGGFVTDTTHQGWNFNGNFTSYIVQDSGQDRLGHNRRVSNTGENRGRVQWQHQHFLPDDWQLQFRAGYVSDPTFLEEWYEKTFDMQPATNLSAYAKRQRDNEAITFNLQYQVSNVVTTSDALTNRVRGTGDTLSDRPFEVDRLPEVGYYRIGESVADDSFTLMSENRVGGLTMHKSDATLADYGFRIIGTRDSVPGIPAKGYTGTTDGEVIRGDFRQEIDYPINAGEFKIVPYGVARYTAYSDSPDSNSVQRILGGVGTRITTAMWKVDNDAHSEFFDVHRVRHVIEPELNLFASAATKDRNDVYIFDETVDGINDIAAANLVIRQRWQTKRGAPGEQRSVDFLAFNVGITAFANKPEEPTNPDRLAFAGTGIESNLGPATAKAFRGLFFQSTPEASIPRSSINTDALWRISDSTIILADASWNIDERSLATAAVGLLVNRDERLNYYTGLRYIGELNSTIASFTSTYQLTAKYTLNFSVAMDLNKTANKNGTITITRKFDRFFVLCTAYYNSAEDVSGFRFGIIPEGLSAGLSTDNVQNALAQ